MNKSLESLGLHLREPVAPATGPQLPFGAGGLPVKPTRWVWALSGGGAKGSFQLGAALALARDRRYTPAGIAGTSVGSVNGLALAHGLHEGLGIMKDLWFGITSRADIYAWSQWANDIDAIPKLRDNAISFKGILEGLLGGSDDGGAAPFSLSMMARKIGGAVRFPLIGPHVAVGKLEDIFEGLAQAETVLSESADGLFTFTPLRKLIELRVRSAAIRDAGLQLRFTTVGLEDGWRYLITQQGEVIALQYAEPGHRTVFRSIGRITTPDFLADAVVASASVPVVNPPVVVQVDGGAAGVRSLHMVDGGVRDVLPIHGALHMIPEIQRQSKEAVAVGVVAVAAGAISPDANDILVNPAEPEAYGPGSLLRTAARSFDLALDEVVASERELLSYQEGFESNAILEISPSFNLGGLTELDPGLIQIGCTYGYMTAFDRMKQLDLRLSFADYRNRETGLWHSTNLIAQLRYKAWQLEREVVRWIYAQETVPYRPFDPVQPPAPRTELWRFFEPRALEAIRSLKQAIAAATTLRIQKWGLDSVPSPEDLSRGQGSDVNCIADWWRHFERHSFRKLGMERPDVVSPDQLGSAFAVERNPSLAAVIGREVSDGPGPSIAQQKARNWFGRAETPWNVRGNLDPRYLRSLIDAVGPFLGFTLNLSGRPAADPPELPPPPATPFEKSPDYCAVRLEGYVLPAAGPGLVPLFHYYNPERKDNMTTRAAAAPGYRPGTPTGFVFDPARERPSNTLPLYTFWSPSRVDHVTTTDIRYTRDGFSPRPTLDLEGGYRYVQLEGYVLDAQLAELPRGAKPLYRWFSPSRLDNFTSANWTVES